MSVNNISKQRAAMEALANMRKSGYFKEIIKMEGALFEEYINCGFHRNEALQLVMNFTKVTLGGKEDTNG